MSRQEGRIHYGRTSTRSEGERGASERPSEAARMPSWYNEESAETKRARRYDSGSSVWAESSDAHTRRAEFQGTARDARRTLQRHENQVRRTQSRSTVYNTGGLQDDVDMFQAVASENRAHGGNRNVLDGVNSRGSWRSSNGSDYPALREHHRMDFLRIALPIVLLILLIIAVVFIVRGCTGA